MSIEEKMEKNKKRREARQRKKGEVTFLFRWIYVSLPFVSYTL
jgi:hypothetical protein